MLATVEARYDGWEECANMGAGKLQGQADAPGMLYNLCVLQCGMPG